MGFGGARSHYDDPTYYWYAYRSRRADVRYYAGLISGTPRVLEYGVGNGRVALAMARAGAIVTGVDLSQPMLRDLARRLERAPKRVRERVGYRLGDMRRLRLNEQFDLVVAPFNTIQHLYTARDLQRFLQRVREHLAPGGMLVFDFTLPRPSDLAFPRRTYASRPFLHTGIGCRVRYRERTRYDPIRQLLHTWMEFDPIGTGRGWRVRLTQRQWFPREIEALLHYNGFGNTRLIADFDPSASFEDVDTIAVRTTPR